MKFANLKLFAMLGALLVASCSVQSMAGNDELNAEAQANYADLAEGRDDALLARMSSANDAATVTAQLPMLRGFVPSGAPPEGTALGWRTNAGTGGQTYAVSHQYVYPDRDVVADTTFIKEGEVWKIQSFNVNAQMKPGAPASAAIPVERRAPES